MNEPEHRFTWYLFEKLGVSDFDDPKIKNMDPVLRQWMYSNWQEDQRDKAEILKNHGYLIASFINPQEVKRLLDNDNKHISNEEEFEESLDIIRTGDIEISPELSKILNTGSPRPPKELIDKQAEPTTRRRRRVIQ